MKIILIKTHVKGLYLTTKGKAWRKDLKIEIPATPNGKIRFNGKLYDLQKLIERSAQKTNEIKIVKPNPPAKKTTSLRELQKQGFKKTQISGLYVSKIGKAYNYDSNRFLTPTAKGTVIINSKGYNLAKLILEIFCKIENRSGQINFINGNDRDFSFENLEYKSTIKQPQPAPADLIKCIRFYFEVDKKLNKNSLMTKYYLYEIIKKRGFELKYKGLDFDLFLEYVKNDFWVLSNNQKNTFDKFNYTATNGKNAINKYLNLLISECLQDFENGLLKLKDFKPKPVRKKSNKQLLNDYNKFSKEWDLNFEKLSNEPPQ